MENVKFKGETATNEQHSKPVTGLQRAFEEIAELKEQIKEFDEKILLARVENQHLNEREQRLRLIEMYMEVKPDIYDGDIVVFDHFVETGEWIGRFDLMERRYLSDKKERQGKDLQQQ